LEKSSARWHSIATSSALWFLREGELTFLRLASIWLTINRGRGPTDDKPEVVPSRPRDSNVSKRLSEPARDRHLALLRPVVFAGAKFITEPKVHATEWRCYLGDRMVTSLK